jgi:hypothetical protein
MVDASRCVSREGEDELTLAVPDGEKAPKVAVVVLAQKYAHGPAASSWSSGMLDQVS